MDFLFHCMCPESKRAIQFQLVNVLGSATTTNFEFHLKSTDARVAEEITRAMMKLMQPQAPTIS